MASYISPGPLCDRCRFCSIQERPDYHSGKFKAISMSPVTGIVFKAYEYSATQLADAFEKIISGHMDFEIKRQALERWNVLLPELLDGPYWRDTEFELKDVFFVLDDFLFLRALRDRCGVEWVDKRVTGCYAHSTGWCESAEVTNRGPTQWIRLVRPAVDQKTSVQEILCTLMHEMCHAIFAFACRCYRCRCPLNRMNGKGFSGHGPSWDKLRRSIEITATFDLRLGPTQLCSYGEFELEKERQQVGRMLCGLHKYITNKGSESAELKRLEREKKWNEETEIFASIEKENTEEKLLDTIACAGDMFRRLEHERVYSPLDKHAVQRNGPEQHDHLAVETLALVQTRTLRRHEDDACEINSNSDQDGVEND